MTTNATASQWWQMTHRGGRAEHLDDVECRRLLGLKSLGRLAYVVDGAPRIVPMNYVYAGDSLYLRTEAGNEASRHAPNAWVGFEIDDFDEFLESGWSVLVVGTARVVSSEQLLAELQGPFPEPWPQGRHDLLLKIHTTSVNGRRILST